MTRFALIVGLAACLPGCDGGAGLIQLIFLPFQIASAISHSQHARGWHWSQGDRRCRASQGTDCSRGGVRFRPEYLPEPQLPPSRSERIRDGGAIAMGCDDVIVTERYDNERYAFSGCMRRAVLDCDELRGGHFFCQAHRARTFAAPQPVATATIATLRPIAIAAPPAMLVAGASPRQSATGQQFCQYTYPTGERHCYASESECQLSTYTSEPDEARRMAACHPLPVAWCVRSGLGEDCFAMESACESRAAELDPANPQRCFVRR